MKSERRRKEVMKMGELEEKCKWMVKSGKIWIKIKKIKR